MTLDFGHSATTVALLAAAGFLAALARGFSGFGAALIFMPLGSALVGPAATAAVMMIVDGLCAWVMVPSAWPLFERRSVVIMAMGATLTVPVGGWILVTTDPTALRWAFCVVIFALLALLMSGWRYRGAGGTGVTVAVGMASGLLSGVAQMGGPPIVVYWLGGQRPPAVMRANIVMFLLWGAVLTAFVYATAGLLDRQVIALSVACGPVYMVGVLLGSRMFGLASALTFRRICYGLIGLAAVLGLPR